MEKIGNSIRLNNSEKKALKKLIDRKYGKITTSIDFESSSGLQDCGIEASIFKNTRKFLSGSTVERIVGLTRDQRKIRSISLEILAEYLEFSNADELLTNLEINSRRGYNSSNFTLESFIKNHLIEIILENNKEISIKYVDGIKFEVLNSKNTKLFKGDNLEIRLLGIGEELVCENVSRNNVKGIKILGPYKSGENNKVKSIHLKL